MLKLPNEEKSYWREVYSESLYSSLANDLEIDVAIIGGGITGLTSAYLLKRSGLKVAVLEKDTIGAGTTGRTTGKVTAQHGLIYHDLQGRLGNRTAQIYGEANQAAVEQIADIVKNEKIKDVFYRSDNYVFTDESNKIEDFKREAAMAQALGLPATFETDAPLPFNIKAAVKFANQGQLHSQKYLLGLARFIHGNGSHVFENSRVTGIRDGNPGQVRTSQASVMAKDIIVATNVPTLPLMARGGYCLLEYPTESYIIAGQSERKWEGMYISPDKHHYSILPVNNGSQQLLLIGGEGHISGLRGSKAARYKRLADYAQQNFGITSVQYRWSDRDYLAYDYVPLIGKLYPWSKHLYVGSAFKKWGLSNGTVAAIILHDLITGQDNRWTDIFTPNRLKPVLSIPRVAAKYIFRKQ
ncbi:MAG TPA: FAD-binding oxidoreductase [Patescibacteria group bacterium]|nr:FAD-binding oxidoreductase [Patescibacteria group bacterium]